MLDIHNRQQYGEKTFDSPVSRGHFEVTFKNYLGEFSGGTVDKNPPANAGDMSLIPDLRRYYHMP